VVRLDVFLCYDRASQMAGQIAVGAIHCVGESRAAASRRDERSGGRELAVSCPGDSGVASGHPISHVLLVVSGQSHVGYPARVGLFLHVTDVHGQTQNIGHPNQSEWAPTMLMSLSHTSVVVHPPFNEISSFRIGSAGRVGISQILIDDRGWCSSTTWSSSSNPSRHDCLESPADTLLPPTRIVIDLYVCVDFFRKCVMVWIFPPEMGFTKTRS
jgi:hypothetical protein